MLKLCFMLQAICDVSVFVLCMRVCLFVCVCVCSCVSVCGGVRCGNDYLLFQTLSDDPSMHQEEHRLHCRPSVCSHLK